MWNASICLVWILALVVWISNCQAQCECSGLLESDQLSGPFAFTYEGQRTFGLVIGFAYGIVCQDNTEVPDWYSDGQLVSDSDSAAVYQISKSANKMTLKFSSFAMDQTGQYTCMKPCGNCTIDISAGNPVINLDTQLDTEEIGSSKNIIVRYAVLADPIPTSDDVTWFHNGELLTFPNSLGVTDSASGNYILINSPLTAQHEGTYTAKVITSAGIGNDSFHLNLNFFPIANLSVVCSECNQSSDGSYTLALQSSITISCSNTVATDIDSLQFTWEKNDQPLVGDNVTITRVSPVVSTLMVDSVDFTDAGIYKCLINNDIGSNTQELVINVLNRPVISRISPQQVTWVSGNDGSIQVLFEGGFPAPNAFWTRQLTGSSQHETVISNGEDFLLSGLHSINLTVIDVVLADAGNYSVTVFNSEGSAFLWFWVDVIVPPRLVPITESPLVLPTGSNVTVEVAIFDAYPLVVEDNITWTPSGGNKTFNGSHASVTLSGISPDNPSVVTIAVSHLAENVSHTFQFTVLNPPDAPVNFTVAKYNGKTCTAIFSWQPAVPVNNITSAITDRFGLESSAASMDQWKEFGDQLYPVSEPQVLDLKPEMLYYFRAYSWSNSVGRGKETMGIQFSTMTDYSPQVDSLIVSSVSSSSIQVSWSSPQSDSDCYTLVSYQLVCQDVVGEDIAYNTSIIITSASDCCSVNIDDLSPDKLYECSVNITSKDASGSPMPSMGASSAKGFTLPKAPPKPPSLSVVPSGNNAASSGNGPSTITIDLSALRDSLTPMDASHIWIAVLRLGTTPTLPDLSPDEMYTSSSSFLDPSKMDNPSSSSNSGRYQPYVAQEFDVGSIPVTFIIGDESNAKRNTLRRQAVNTYNGPLVTSDYYTSFVRVFSPSSLSDDKQYKVFTSTSYLVPVKPDSGDPVVAEGLSGWAIFGVIFVILIVVVGVSVAVVVVLLYFKRNKFSANKQMENGNLNVERNTNVSLKSFTNSTPDDLDNHNGINEHKFPLDKHSDSSFVQKDTPLTFRNPTYDHLQQQVSQRCYLEASSSPVPDNFSDQLEVSPDRSNSATPSPVSSGTEEMTLKASQRISREDFQEHMDQLDANDQAGFAEEFNYIEKHSVKHPAIASCEAQPLMKNRYRNITAFDHTRVKLKVIKDVAHSDYINANLVKGYDDRKLYIATQGPNFETHCDFWRMVWEYQSSTIVMLTKLVENCKEKCYKYWPEIEEKSRAYGDVVVRQDQCIILPYYTIRSFKIIPAIGSDTERTVLQFHYTDWPDSNVPALASPLIDFLRAINSANKDTECGPVVVHCSAGVGRTGTIIALDMCLDQLQQEETIDVRGVVAFLRQHRLKMVQVLPQYIFVHHALLEAIVYGDSSVLLKNFPEYYKRLQLDNCELISEEFGKICKVKPPAQANPGPDIAELKATSPTTKAEMLFPAHYVDGYWVKRKFIVCANPSAETIGQFWHLVWEAKCPAIVMVTPNDFQHFNYLHEADREAVFGNLRVKIERQQYKTGFISRNIIITNDFNGTSWNVRHMQYECWVSRHFENMSSFVRFVNDTLSQAELPSNLKQPILVHDDGVCGSAGALVTLAYCFQRVRQERIVDLLQTVNRLHLQCPNLIHMLQLYGFCYDCLQEFTAKLLREDSVPPIYENIASIRGRLQPVSTPPPDPQQELIDSYDIIS